MNFKSKAVKFAVPLIALIMLCGGLFAVIGPSGDSDAKTFTDIGDLTSAADIDIAPGFTYTYTLKFPSDLNEGLTVDTPVTPDGATVTPVKKVEGEIWGTVTVAFPSDMEPGTYDLVIKAYHAESNQTQYQYITFNVKTGIVFTPDCEAYDVNYVGKDVSFDVNVTAGYGSISTITIVETDSALSLSEPAVIDGGKKVTISGTITEAMADAGSYSVTLKATTSNGEWATKSIKVYAAHELGTTLSFTASDKTTAKTSLAAIDGNGDTLYVKLPTLTIDENRTLDWNITNPLQGIVSFDEVTRTFTLQSDDYIPAMTVNVEVTYTVNYGTDETTLVQKATGSFIVMNEAKNLDFTLDQASILTYTGNPDDKTINLSINGSHSRASLTITEINGVSLSTPTVDSSVRNATITISGDVAPTATTTVTVTMETQLHKIVTKAFELTVEDVLTLTGADADKKLVIVTTGECKITDIITATAANANITVTASSSYAGASVVTPITNGNLKVTCSSPGQTFTVTVTATTDAGQTDSIEYTIKTFSPLTFDGQPEAGAISYEVATPTN